MTHEMRPPNGDVIREGDYGRTRDGRKVGPMALGQDAGSTSYRWTDNPSGKGRWDDRGEDGGGFVSQVSAYDIIAAWRDEPAEPKLWRDMTPEEKGALLLANHEGRTIERWVDESLGWKIVPPQWRREHAYRVRPEPKRETVALYFGELKQGALLRKVRTDTHRITFDLIDGQPDFSSIRMEKLP